MSRSVADRTRTQTWAARLCILAGAALLVVYAVPTVYGAAMARLAEAQFRVGRSAQSQWNGARIRAFEAALRLPSAPPEAILRVPRLELEAPLLEGTTAATLNRGVGHVAGTALPGERGNLAIAGHRDGFFRALKDVVPGDTVELERAAPGGRGVALDRYKVRSTAVVSPNDLSVLRAGGGSTLTLITCYPFYYVGAAPERFIVKATLLPAPTSSRFAPQQPPQGD